MVRQIGKPVLQVPVPAGTYVALVFKVTSHTAIDGSPATFLDQVDRHGNETNWHPEAIELTPDTAWVLDGPDELHSLTPIPRRAQ